MNFSEAKIVRMFRYLIIQTAVLFLLALPASAQMKPQIDTFLQGAMITGIAGYNGNLWISTYGRGIFKYSMKDGQWTNFSTQKGGLQQDFFYCITVSDRYVWAGSSDGLFTYDQQQNTWRKRKFGKGGELGNWIRAIAYDKDIETVWVGRFKYLTKYEVEKNRFTDIDLTVNGDVKSNNIKTIKLDGDSVVYFGTESGIHKYLKSMDIADPSSRQYISNSDNYFNGQGDAISAADILFEQNSIWFGLDEFVTPQKPNFNIGGLYHFDRQHTWERFDNSTGFAGNGIFCLARTGNVIWASLYEFNREKKEQRGQGIALINRIDKNVSRISKDELNLPSDKITSMYFDGDYMWMGTEAGLLRLKITNELARWK